MKGLELSKAYYEQYGAPMIHENFPELEGILAAGLCGSGSECYGFDDEVSRDHDFEPGFCIFLPGTEQIDERTEFRIQRAYSHLPKEFMGFRRGILSPVGGNRHGAIRAADYFVSKCGSPDGSLSEREWLLVPESALAEAINGEIFRDDSGIMTAVREKLACYPEDIRRKKLAGYVLTMAQAGQYNYPRCIARGESGAAQLAVYEFVTAAMHVIFLLNRRYMPYYKWSFRALRELPELSGTAVDLEWLISSGNAGETAAQKAQLIEDLSRSVTGALEKEGLTDASCADLEKHAYSVNDHVKSGTLRNANIFAGV